MKILIKKISHIQKRMSKLTDYNTYVISHLRQLDYLKSLIDILEGTEITLQREIIVVLGGIRIDDQLHA